MNRRPPTQQEIIRLAFEASENNSQEARQQLRDLLRDFPGIRTSVGRFMGMRANLHWMLALPLDQSSKTVALARQSTTSGLSRRHRAWIVMACLVLAMGGWWSRASWQRPQAVIEAAFPSNLVGGDQGLTEKSLPLGKRVELPLGLFRFRFAGGATAIVQGPVALTIHSKSHLSLWQGDLTIRVPTGKPPFRITTPRGDFVGSEGRIAVSVSPDGPVELHVREGTVFPESGSLANGENKVVTAGQALRLSKNAEPTALDSGRFPWDLNFDSAVSFSKPVSSWNFAQETWETAGRVTGVRSSRGEPQAFSVHGNVFLAEDAGRQHLEFADFRRGSYLRSDSLMPVFLNEAFTLELCVRPEQLRHSTLLALKHWTSERPQPVDSLLVEIAPWGFPDAEKWTPANTFRAVYREQPAAVGPVSIFTPPTVRQQEWYHLVLVKTPQSLQLWVNGQEAASGSVTRPLKEHDYVVVGDLLGTRDLPLYPVLYRPYWGRMSQLSMYDRALSKDEIQWHSHLFHVDIRNAGQSDDVE